jgi:hypothetical protein
MSEDTGSVQTTFEEAKRCPKCNQPGDDRKQLVLLNRDFKGGKAPVVHHIYCVTELCPWYDTPWLVQVNGDGTIPPKTNHTGSPKEYHGDFGTPQEAKDIIDGLKRQAQAETQGGAEIPYRRF